MRIALIGCSKTKLSGVRKTKELYASILFRLAWEYATRNFEKVFILSAKYGLLEPERHIACYDLTLNTMAVDERKQWSATVARQIGENTAKGDELHFLCGKRYWEFVAQRLKERSCVFPLEGLAIGQQLQWYKTRL